LREQKKIVNTNYKLNILENTMENVKQLCLNSEDLANSSPSYAVQVLSDCDSYMFEDVMDMDYCAAKAGMELLSFEEYIGRVAHGSCEEEAFREQQAIGIIRRVSLNSGGDEADLKHKESVKEYLLKMSTICGSSEIDKPTTDAPDAITEAVSGSHYNDVIPGWQYMEMMEHMLADKKGVEAHLLGQIYKYLFRTGKKDDVEQEYRKARWYINCLVKFKQTGKVDCEGND